MHKLKLDSGAWGREGTRELEGQWGGAHTLDGRAPSPHSTCTLCCASGTLCRWPAAAARCRAEGLCPCPLGTVSGVPCPPPGAWLACLAHSAEQVVGAAVGELDSLPAQTLTPSADPGACSLPSELQRRGPPTASAPPCSLSTHCSQADPARCPARRWPVLVPCVSPGHRCSGHVFPSRPHQRREGRACAGAPHPLGVSSHPHTYPTDMCQVLSATCGLWDIILVAGDSAGGGRQCGRAY